MGSEEEVEDRDELELWYEGSVFEEVGEDERMKQIQEAIFEQDIHNDRPSIHSELLCYARV